MTSTASATGSTSGAAPTFQSTVSTTIPLSLSLAPLSTSSIGFASLGDTVSTTSTPRLVQNPEPLTILLLASGLGVLAWHGRKRRRTG